MSPNTMKIIAHIWAIYILLLFAIAFRYSYRPIRKPPLSTRIACLMEMCFGVFFALISITFKGYSLNNFLLKMSLHVIGLTWLILVIQLYKGNSTARTIFLVLLIVRIFTVIGALMSFVSIFLLYFPKSSKAHFQKQDYIVPAEASDSQQSGEDVNQKDSIIGMRAICVTDLRPVGKIDINGKIFHGISPIHFTEKGTKVKIIEKRGVEYVVEPLPPARI